ncbi:MAG: nucleotide exchange factor GrpE [Nitrospinae bacterium]|nr:nucleotide exchange factor GrpE [Nitrospinota bacterium]
MSKEQDATASGATTGETPQEQPPVETHSETIARLNGEAAKLKHELLLARADFENARRRIEKQKQDELKYSALPLARDLAVVLDNLELALNHAAQDDPMRQGVAMVLDGMMKTLAKFNIERIQAKGTKFNPSLHEALLVTSDINQPDDMVVSEGRAGYLLHDRLIRPAGVIVNRHPHQAEEAPADGPKSPE